MYVTLLPVILAGVANMLFVKTPILKAYYTPLDNHRTWIDGQPIFGDNKTWKGFWGMTGLAAIMMCAWGAISSLNPELASHNLFYQYHANTLSLNILIGLALGLAYVIFELPNSFLKRRLRVKAGKTPRGLRGIPYLILDQADSIFGCVLVVAILTPMTLAYYLAYVAVGAITHIVLNVLL